MSEKLKLAAVESKDGNIFINLSGGDGKEYHLPLSGFDVSTLVSMLYEVRSDAMSQPNDKDPEVMLQIRGLSFGESADHQILRVEVTEYAYQDFCAPKESEAGEFLRQFSLALAKASGQTWTPFGHQGTKQ